MDNKTNRMMIATMALQGMLASGKVGVGESKTSAVKTAVAYADEMLKQLEESEPKNANEN